MNSKQYDICIQEAQQYTDRDAYVSDLSLSSMWEDEEGAEVPSYRIRILASIWDAVHRSFREILTDGDVSRTEFSLRFSVPLRTVENWLAGTREPPLYVRLAFQQLLGLHMIAID